LPWSPYAIYAAIIAARREDHLDSASRRHYFTLLPQHTITPPLSAASDFTMPQWIRNSRHRLLRRVHIAELIDSRHAPAIILFPPPRLSLICHISSRRRQQHAMIITMPSQYFTPPHCYATTPFSISFI